MHLKRGDELRWSNLECGLQVVMRVCSAVGAVLQ
jgi:hypothetical protein